MNEQTKPDGRGKHGKQGRKPNAIKTKRRPVYFSDARWKALLETGNASHALNKLCDGAGIPEQPITDKN